MRSVPHLDGFAVGAATQAADAASAAASHHVAAGISKNSPGSRDRVHHQHIDALLDALFPHPRFSTHRSRMNPPSSISEALCRCRIRRVRWTPDRALRCARRRGGWCIFGGIRQIRAEPDLLVRCEQRREKSRARKNAIFLEKMMLELPRHSRCRPVGELDWSSLPAASGARPLAHAAAVDAHRKCRISWRSGWLFLVS